MDLIPKSDYNRTFSFSGDVILYIFFFFLSKDKKRVHIGIPKKNFHITRKKEKILLDFVLYAWPFVRFITRFTWFNQSSMVHEYMLITLQKVLFYLLVTVDTHSKKAFWTHRISFSGDSKNNRVPPWRDCCNTCNVSIESVLRQYY